MGKIFVGQTALKITLKCHCNITHAVSTKIRYKKPGNPEVEEWDAEVEDAINGEIYYHVQDGDIDTSGNWKLWAYIIFSNNTVAAGETVYLNIYTEGD